MMKNAAVAAFALLASTVLADYGYSATGIGSANVINNCNYPVKLCNVPSSGGGGTEEDTSLEPGASWSQKWTSLTNGNGWSIKLSKTDNLNHILQYEYTFHNDGIIWYDLSCVDGNPWDGDWEVTANGTTCKPKQQAYRYSTDDAYGMQSCSQDSVITVTLCTGTSVDNGEALNGASSSATSSSAPAYSAPAASSPSSPPAYQAPSSAPAYQAPAPSSAPAVAPQPYGHNKGSSQSNALTPTPTTLATYPATTASSNEAGAVTITQIETVYTTAEVTVYNRHRRHEHNHAH